jgi:hypothetical protein
VCSWHFSRLEHADPGSIEYKQRPAQHVDHSTVDIEYKLPDHKPFLGGFKTRMYVFDSRLTIASQI